MDNSISEVSLVKRQIGADLIWEKFLAISQINKHMYLSVEVKKYDFKEVDDEIVSKVQIA